MTPTLYLAIDNCFATKRWTEPEEWMTIARELGLFFVEASADTECDPLYTTAEYRRDWLARVRRASKNTGVTVSQLYSGHGTYATLGLSHTSAEIRRHMMENWMKPMCELSGSLGACLGFFCHAFSQAVLQDGALYRRKVSELCGALAQVAGWAKESGCESAGVETMYSPHQIPWTLPGAEELLGEVNRLSDAPFYLSVDVGHQAGQSRFQRPTPEELRQGLLAFRENPDTILPWLGGKAAYDRFRSMTGSERDFSELEALMDGYPWLFAGENDGKTEMWLERFGCYSPIIHLQQTDGRSSKHLPFTPEHNAAGVIRGEMVLDALRRSYGQPGEDGMPPKAKKLYLTLEIFSGTADRPDDILRRLKESVRYWRRFIPRDGMTLGELTGHDSRKADPALTLPLRETAALVERLKRELRGSVV